MNTDNFVVAYTPTLIAKWEKELATVRANMQVLPSASYSPAMIVVLHNVKVSLEKKVDEAQSFMKACQTPQKQCVLLTNNILKKCEAFNHSHALNQNVEMRLALYKLDEKLNSIITNNPYDLPNYSAQLRYLALCGFLWKMYDDNKNNKAFAEVLEELLASTHIVRDGDYPEPYQIQSSTSSAYAEFAPTGPGEKELEQAEYINFYDALKTLEAELHADIYSQSANEIAYAIREKVKHSQKNLYFYTEVLQQTTAILKSPHNVEAQQRFTNLMQQAEGYPSVGLKVTGAMLIFTGITMLGVLMLLPVAVPMVTCLATVTTLTPLMSTLACSVIPIGLIASGAGIFAAGMRTSISEKMKHFLDTMQHEKTSETSSKHAFA